LEAQTATRINGTIFKMTKGADDKHIGMCLTLKDIPPDDVEDKKL